MSRTSTSRTAGIADLVAIVALVAGFDLLVVATGATGTPLHLLLGLPLLVFAPGYAVAAALYPRANEAGPSDGVERESPTVGPPAGAVDGVTRFAISVVASLALVGGVGIALHLSPWPIATPGLLAGITIVTLVAVAAAALRRSAVPRSRRYAPPVSAGSLWRAVRPRASASFIVGIVFVASVVAAAAVVGGAATSDDPGEVYTEFTVLTESEGGDLVAANYSEAIADDRPLQFYVENHEGESAEYTIVVVQETVAVADGEPTVTAVSERGRTTVQLDAGATRTVEYEANPIASDGPRRLHAFLYQGDAPETPDESSAYRSLHVWVDDAPAVNGTADAN